MTVWIGGVLLLDFTADMATKGFAPKVGNVLFKRFLGFRAEFVAEFGLLELSLTQDVSVVGLLIFGRLMLCHEFGLDQT